MLQSHNSPIEGTGDRVSVKKEAESMVETQDAYLFIMQIASENCPKTEKLGETDSMVEQHGR